MEERMPSRDGEHARSDENRAIVRRVFEEVLNSGDLAVADKIMAADFIEHHPRPGQGPGRDGFKHRATMLRTAFPDLQYVIEDELAVADKVVVRVTAHGTHKGVLAGLSPTGNQFTMTGIVIFRLAGGKIVERWANYDNLTMLQDLGAIPTLGRPRDNHVSRAPVRRPRSGWSATARPSPTPSDPPIHSVSPSSANPRAAR